MNETPPPADDLDDELAEMLRARDADARVMILTGVVLLVVGLAITIVTYGAAAGAHGGRYVVAVGPIVVGCLRIVRGVAALG